MIPAQVAGGVAVNLFEYGWKTNLALQQVSFGALFFSKKLLGINQLAKQRIRCRLFVNWEHDSCFIGICHTIKVHGAKLVKSKLCVHGYGGG